MENEQPRDRKTISLSPEAKKECKKFFEFCDTIRGTERFYTKDDIDKANKMLDCLIKELS